MKACRLMKTRSVFCLGKTGVSSVTLRNVYDKPVALEDGSLRAIQDETTGDWVITKNSKLMFMVDWSRGLK